MFVTITGMTVVLAMGSFAIDTARWEQKHHQVQLATDAAALAAANCLADAGATGNQCTSTSDTTDATNVAVQIAADNGLTITSSDISYNSSTVTVSASGRAGSVFAEVFGIGGSTQRASSSASWNTSGICTTAGDSCYAIFAYNATCNTAKSTSADAPGVTNNGNSSVLHGGVHSNGNIYNNGNKGGATFPDYVTFGNNCPTTDNMGLPATAASSSSTMPYPLDFSGLSPAADGNDVSPPACTYTAGDSTPPTGVTFNPLTNTLTVSGSAPSGVYCNTSGTINISGSSAAGGYNTPGGDTYIAAKFTGLSNNDVSISAYNNGNANPYHLLLYEVSPHWNGTTCSGTDPDITLGGNTKQMVDGVVFAPCGSIVQYANNSADAMFLEAYNVNLAGNATFSGAGPNPSGTGYASSSGTDALSS